MKGEEDEHAVPSCQGLLSVLACTASHPSYMVWRGENGKDPTKRKKLLDYSVRFYLPRKRRTNGRLPSNCSFNACGHEIQAIQQGVTHNKATFTQQAKVDQIRFTDQI